ncbi:hypothetical protein GCM10025868_07940 [Angustibacter aerolatus]|uniref:IspG TIM-barrel domain-containing protein n=1 Tax=Angustibacter aerolatus TaxID=1162965 RepID=A0ABQ6JCP2_9ACTN|nr:hypothetical protein GCM10025868_07940 [Angustibacter aerolatus]
MAVGGDAPVSVQSMTTTPTTDVNATLQQIAALTATGCDIVRVACPSQDDAEALPAIARKSQIPVIADIHFQPKYVFAAIDAGCAAVRVNPGNIRQFDDQVKDIAKAAKDAGVSIRIGVNAGSLDRRLLAKYGKATPEALVESAVWEASLFEEHDFHDFKISVKHNDPVVMVRAYEPARRAGRLAAAPRRHRGRPGVPGHHQVGHRVRCAVVEGHRRHDPRLAVGASRRGGQGRHPDPAVAEPAPAQGSRSCRAPRAGARRSTSTRRPRRSPPGSRGSRCRCASPSWAAS